MVPSRIVFVDSLPLGAGGKIDRDALRSRPLPLRDDKFGETPQTETETLLADIWAEALELSEITRDDDFFSLGGDSLKGAVVAAQIYAAFGIEVNLAAIADHPTVSTLASHIDECRRAGPTGQPPIVAVPRTGPMPLSVFQERVWKASEVRPVEVCARTYGISGPVDAQILSECLGYLVERHEILRTTIAMIDGRPMQIVHPSAPVGFSYVDVSAAEDPEEQAETACKEEAAKAIDTAKLPVTRHVLIRTGETEHWLLRLTHSLTQDGWSFTILMNELAALYEARVRGLDPPIPKAMPLQYVDYAVWHRELMRPDGPVYEEMLAWWKQVFAKRIRTTKLPFRRSVRETGVDPGRGVVQWKLDDEVAARLDAVARRAGATHFVVRLACFIALIADLGGRSTVVIGTNFANRHRAETRNIVGLLTNLVPLVFPYRRRLPFREWLETVRDRLFDTEARAEIPYEELYRKLRAAGLKPPGVGILFTISADLGEQRMGDVSVIRRPYPVGTMPWGCQVYIDERVPGNCRVDFDANLYPPEEMAAMVDRYLRLLEAASRLPNMSIGRLVAMSSSNPVRRVLAALPLFG
jgi:acyl carrier protein